ncbi:hypothetical protein IAU60_000091 [Kwoniella sp. DSM 27419]
MTVTVGLLSHSGLVGKYFLHYLYEAQNAGSIRVVVLHRDGSDLSAVPHDVETRIVQLDKAGISKTAKAVGDLDVVVSAIAREARPAQIPLVDALAHSSTIKVFIPADYDLDWRPEGDNGPAHDLFLAKEQVYQRAEEKGVPYVRIIDGMFDNYFFENQTLGTDIKSNKVRLFRDAIHRGVRLTTLEYFGYAIAQLVKKPWRLAGQDIQLYDYNPTGQDIIDVLTKIHGEKPSIEKYTEDQWRKDSASKDKAVGAGIHRKWAEGIWGHGEKVEVTGWHADSFEELTRTWLDRL